MQSGGLSSARGTTFNKASSSNTVLWRRAWWKSATQWQTHDITVLATLSLPWTGRELVTQENHVFWSCALTTELLRTTHDLLPRHGFTGCYTVAGREKFFKFWRVDAVAYLHVKPQAAVAIKLACHAESFASVAGRQDIGTIPILIYQKMIVMMMMTMIQKLMRERFEYIDLSNVCIMRWLNDH